MSKKTVNMSVEQEHMRTKSGPSSQGGLQLVLLSGDRNGNSVPCPGSSTPESLRSLSSLSDGSTTSPPDVDMMEVCLSQGSPIDNPTDTETLANSTFVLRTPEVTVGGEVDMEPVQTSNTSLDNRNITLVIASLQRRHGAPSGRRSTETGDEERDTTEERDSLPGSGEASRRGSSENGCCSISSGEMVMRSNSFCLGVDKSLTALSSPTLPAELSLLSATLPDVCEGLLEDRITEEVTGENTGPQCWGMTFIQSDDQELPPEDGHMVESRSQDSVGPPGEGGHMQTFLYDPAPSASGGVSPAPGSMAGPDADLRPYFTGGSTPGEGRTFVVSASEELDSSCNAQTSTPVQHLDGNKTFCFLSLNESPFTATPGSPVSRTPKDQRGAVTPKQRLVARLPPSTSRISKAEIKTFPKPDFSRVRPKIMSRPVHSMASPALAKTAPRKPSHVTTPSILSQGTKNTPMKTAHTTSVLGGTPSKAATVDDSQSMAVNAGPLYLGMTFIQSDDEESPTAGSPAASLTAAEEGERSRRASLCDSIPAAFEHTPSTLCRQGGQASQASSEAEQVASCSGGFTSVQCPTGNQTFCFPSHSEVPPIEDRADPKPSPANSSLRKEEVLNRNKKRPDSACNQEKAPALKPRSRCWSECSSSSKPPRESPRACPNISDSFTTAGAHVQLGPSRPGTQVRPAQNRQPRQPEARRGTPEKTSREIKKISLVTASSKASVAGGAGAACEGSKSRLGVRPSPSRTRGAPAASRAPAASPRPPPPPTAPRQRLGTSGRDGRSSTSGTMASPRPRQNSTPSNQRAPSVEGASVGASSTTSSIKPPLAGSRPPQTTGRPPAIGHLSALTSRLPYKLLGPPRTTPSKASEPSVSTVNTQVSAVPGEGPSGTPVSSKTTLLRARLFSHPGRNTGPALATGCKTTAVTNQMAQRSGTSPLKRTASSRLARPTAGLPVDKNRAKASPRTQQQPPPQQPPPPPQSSGRPDLVPTEGRAGGKQENYRAQCERTNQNLQQLRGLLAASNCRFEAVTVVLQQALAERDEVVKQRRELSQELMTLRGELVSSAHSCERLEQEKDEVRVALEGVLQKVQDQHQSDLAQLEERLRAFYQAEWDTVHLTYQEEADRCKALMEQQMGELRANHEALKLEIEASHSEQLQSGERQHQDSLEELRKGHDQEMQMLDKTLKEAEATLSAQIQELTSENTTLNDRLKAEEERRRELAEKNLKDSHTLYLEQELESLKVVLDIKNKQLHQQERKLMQMDKLVDKNVKLDECLIKVQQENEDLKARMDRHAALSRQLSTEQAMLQETLHKESKVNKRLSMEKEELIWKLHNGDLASPRKMSPTSPSHSLSLQSPRSSAIFSSPPLSPR